MLRRGDEVDKSRSLKHWILVLQATLFTSSNLSSSRRLFYCLHASAPRKSCPKLFVVLETQHFAKGREDSLQDWRNPPSNQLGAPHLLLGSFSRCVIWAVLHASCLAGATTEDKSGICMLHPTWHGPINGKVLVADLRQLIASHVPASVSAKLYVIFFTFVDRCMSGSVCSYDPASV